MCFLSVFIFSHRKLLSGEKKTFRYKFADVDKHCCDKHIRQSSTGSKGSEISAHIAKDGMKKFRRYCFVCFSSQAMFFADQLLSKRSPTSSNPSMSRDYKSPIRTELPVGTGSRGRIP